MQSAHRNLEQQVDRRRRAREGVPQLRREHRLADDLERRKDAYACRRARGQLVADRRAERHVLGAQVHAQVQAGAQVRALHRAAPG
jgi:hypothetical protein